MAHTLWLLPLLFSAPAALRAAHLQPATTEAWDDYLQSAKARVQARFNSGEPFLWVDEDADRLQKVQAGEVVVSSVGPNPKKVPGGLVHDWVGTVFIPDSSLQDVLRVVRDYARYKDLYQPGVVESRAIETKPNRDRFTMRLINRSVMLKTAFDADYESCFVQMDERRVYSVSQTSRVQQIEEYGSEDQHMLPAGSGNGVIWRLAAITKYVQRDGGVYIEIEGMGLSRDIPLSVRWLVEPMVRRVSRNSLAISLRQTENAVSPHVDADRRQGSGRTFVQPVGQSLLGGESSH